jgi:hypothetical protein
VLVEALITVRDVLALSRDEVDAVAVDRLVETKAAGADAFTDWTDANHLRYRRFIALRDDKDPREIVRENDSE